MIDHRILVVVSFFFLLIPYTSTSQTISFNWANSVGGNSQEQLEELVTDNFSNVYSIGNFQDSVDFDPGVGTTVLNSYNSLYDVFIQKLDSNGSLKWAKSFGGSMDDFGRAISVDINNNVYVTGGFAGTVDFNPGSGVYNLSSNGQNDIFIVKLNSRGNFVWAKKVGGSKNDEGRAIAVDNQGHVYLSGEFESTVDFNPGIAIVNKTSSGQEDAFIEKLDTNGNFIWIKTFGGSSSCYSRDVQLDNLQNIYLTGDFIGSADFNPGTGVFNRTSVGNTDYFIQKLDSAGSFLWAKTFGSTLWDVGYSILVDRNNNVIIGGDYYGTIDFDPGSGVSNLVSNGSSDVFLHKLDSNGNFIWAKSLGGNQDDDCSRIANDKNGNIYVSGIFAGTADFNPGSSSYNLVSKGREDVFIQKSDVNGNFLFAYSIGGIDKDRNFGLAIDSNSSIFLGGHYRGTSDFDPNGSVYNLKSKADYDISVVKLSPFCVPVSSTIKVRACDSFTKNGIVYITNDTIIDSLKRVGGCDSIVITELTIDKTSYGTDTIVACEEYTWNGIVYTNGNNTAKDTLKNKSGCDSIITLNLTILKASHVTDSVLACDSYLWNGITYTSSNYSATDTLRNILGCDSIITLKLTIRQLDTTNIFESACDSFLWKTSNSKFHSTGIYKDTFQNIYGCDSLVSLSLTVNSTYNTSDKKTACFSYKWINGITYSSNNNQAQFTLKSDDGCDSVISLDLVINAVGDSIDVNENELTAIENGANYQWLDCKNGFTPIMGQTRQSFIVKKNGSYAVRLNKNFCVDTSKCVDFFNVGYAESRILEQIILFPNPISKGSNEFQVQFFNLENVSMEIYNSVGKLVLTEKSITNLNHTVEILESAGIYSVVINSNDQRRIIKLVKY